MIDEVMDQILDLIQTEGGQLSTEPGRLLSSLASEVWGCDVHADGRDKRYHMTCAAVRQLEEWGFVEVVRLGNLHPEKGNRVCGIALM